MKKFCKIMSLILVFILAFCMVSCGNDTATFSEEFVLEEFDDIVRKIKSHHHVYVEDTLPGMTQSEYTILETLIHGVIHDTGDYEIVHRDTKSETDDDGNLVYTVKYTIKSGDSDIDISAIYVEGEKTLNSIKLG